MKNRSFARLTREILLVFSLAAIAHGQEPTLPSTSGIAQASPGESGVAANAAASSPLRVVCSGDQLTISAHGVPLSSILAEIGRCTGAKMDIPDSASDSRFFDTIGPGPVGEVLASLLSSANFNFVIGSSATDPDKIETVVVTVESKTASDAKTSDDRPLTPLRQAFQEMRQNRAASLQQENDAPAAGDPNASATSDQSASPVQAQEPAAPVPDPPTPSTTAAASAEADKAAAKNNPVENQINSMEQMFRQRSQMNQNQSSPQAQVPGQAPQ